MSDIDGVSDYRDEFPRNANESLDSDDDGVGDNNDGVDDSHDAFPLNAEEAIDTDGDGVGDNEDLDDDNDGIADIDDVNPTTPDDVSAIGSASIAESDKSGGPGGGCTLQTNPVAVDPTLPALFLTSLLLLLRGKRLAGKSKESSIHTE